MDIRQFPEVARAPGQWRFAGPLVARPSVMFADTIAAVIVSARRASRLNVLDALHHE